MIQHCQQALSRYAEERIYKTYIADSMWAISHGKALEQRIIELLPPITNPLRDAEQDADEIISRITSGLAKFGERE